MQNWPVLLFVLGVTLAVALAMLTLREGPFPYKRRGALLPPAELALFSALQAAVRDQWLVFSRVPLAGVLQVRPGTSPSQGWQRKLSGKYIDFVLCDRESLEVKLAIVAVDAGGARRATHQFIALAAASAGLPLVSVQVHEAYDPLALRKDIEAALGIVRKKKRA